MPSYQSFQEFNLATGFEAKAGFKLKPKQVTAIEDSYKHRKVLNKLAVGCGKTVVSTATSLMWDNSVTIVTVPPILVPDWVRWLEKVSERVIAYEGPKRKTYDLKAARWIVCTHAIYRDDHDLLMAAVKGRTYDCICDEAHWMKNPKSVLFRKFKTMTLGNHEAQLLTGTPVNKPLDGYSYIKIKSPNLYRNMTHYESVHVAERDFYKNPKVYAHLDLLRERLDLQSVTGTKEEVHGYDLKPLFPDSKYKLDPAHKKLYDRLVHEQLLIYEDETVIDASTPQRLQHALQQAVVNWDHFGNDPKLRSAAYDMLDLMIEETECDRKDKTKLLVWTKYQRTSAAVLQYLNDKGIKTMAAYGGSDSRKAVDHFERDENTRILVAQPQSVGAGLNPQYVCSEAIYLEMDTVVIYARQSLGRIDRMGQTKVPRTRICIAQGTVQEYLFKMLMSNDDTVTQIEPSKKGLREMLLGSGA